MPSLEIQEVMTVKSHNLGGGQVGAEPWREDISPPGMSQVLGQGSADLRFSASHLTPSVMVEAALNHNLKMFQTVGEANLQAIQDGQGWESRQW